MAPHESPDRYIEGGGLGLDLYRDVAELPLVSPHGHIDVRLFSRPDARLEAPGRLFVTSDHYVVRMLYSQGVPLEATRGEDRDVWKLLVDNADLFALTPSGLWLRETLAGVFGIHELTLDAYDAIEAQLASPEFAPRALLDRFGVECLATTDPAGAPLDDHQGLAPRIRPTFRPDAVVALDAPGWREAVAELDVDDYASFIDALIERRLAFKEMGATATDHAATSADTTRLRERRRHTPLRACARRRRLVRRGAQLRGAHAERVRTHEPRRRSRHAAPRRQLPRPQRAARRALRRRPRRRHPGRRPTGRADFGRYSRPAATTRVSR